MVAVALIATVTVGPLSGARPGWGKVVAPEHRAVIAEALAAVPDGASVAADNALGAHLSERERITVFPLLAGADYVVLDSQGRYGPWRGRALERLRRNPPNAGVAALLSEVDVLIDGPFIQSLNDSVGLRGSSNQRIIHLTSRLKQYDLETSTRNVEITVTDGELAFIGIPTPGILSAMK